MFFQKRFTGKRKSCILKWNTGKKGTKKVEREKRGKGRGLLRTAAMLLPVGGIVWFLLPLLRGGFGLGSSFGVGICLLGAALLTLWKRKKGSRRLRLALTSLYGLGLLWAGILTLLMLSASVGAPPAGKNVIVLGSKVYSAEHPGVALSLRLNAAFGYLDDNPESRVILTGTQGADEPCAESLTAKNELLRRGLDPARIFREERSRNTRENFRYAWELAQEEGLGEEFVVVTQRFHMYRALALAGQTLAAPDGRRLKVWGLCADTQPLLLPEYYGRELLSLTKFFAESALRGIRNEE